MKKLFLSGILLLAGSMTLFAQNVVNGTVVDKDKNPVPGAKVEVVGSTESTITELDGTFRLETQSPARKVKVRYVGMQSKTQEVEPNMLVTLTSSKIMWNVKVGYGLANFIGDAEDNSMKPSLKVGVGVDIPLGGKWLLMPSIEYKQKGYKSCYEDEDTKEEDKITLHYFQLPILMGYKIGFNSNAGMTLKFGPYLAYAFKGKEKYEYSYNGKVEKESFDLFDETDVKRFDCGVSLGVDFEYKRFVIGAEADFGCLNIMKDEYDDLKMYNAAMYFSVGYKF